MHTVFIDVETGQIFWAKESAERKNVKSTVEITGVHVDILRVSHALKQKYDTEQKRKKTGARRGARKVASK